MFCKSCGKVLEGNPRFCMNCGAELFSAKDNKLHIEKSYLRCWMARHCIASRHGFGPVNRNR